MGHAGREVLDEVAGRRSLWQAELQAQEQHGIPVAACVLVRANDVRALPEQETSHPMDDPGSIWTRCQQSNHGARTRVENVRPTRCGLHPGRRREQEIGHLFTIQSSVRWEAGDLGNGAADRLDFSRTRRKDWVLMSRMTAAALLIPAQRRHRQRNAYPVSVTGGCISETPAAVRSHDRATAV